MITLRLLRGAVRGASTLSPGQINKMNASMAESNIELPSKPKKPVTPWIMFVRDRKDQIVTQRGSRMSAPEISSVLAQEWQQMDKSSYQQEYQRMHETYAKLVKEYEESLTDDHRDLIEHQKELKRETKAMKQLKKTKPPVLPRNPANLYCQERSKQADVREMLRTHKSAEVFSKIFKEYRSLSDSERRKYLDMQEEDKARFQHEFLAWFETVQNNENLSRAAREQANAMRERLRALGYV